MEQSEQQRSPLFFFALFVVIMVMTYKVTVWDPYFSPKPIATENVTATTMATPATGAVSTPSIAGTPAPEASKPQSIQTVNNPTNAEILKRGVITFRTNSFLGEISRLGGRLVSLKLLQHGETLGVDSPRLELVSHQDGTPYPLGVYSENLDDSAVLYSFAAEKIETTPGSKVEIALTGTLPDGRAITKSLELNHDGYFFGLNVSTQPVGAPLSVELSQVVSKESPSWLDHYGSSGYVWYDGSSANREMYYQVPEERKVLGNAKWIALSDKYFSTAIIASGSATKATSIHKGEDFRVQIGGDASDGSFRILAGPNNYRMLRDAGDSLELILNFGRLSFLCAPILSLLHFFFNLFANYGLAIVALTITVKLALLPLTAASFKSMQAMQEVQPEVQRIRETITDRQQQQVQLMALYKKRGVNPLGGCLPMLLQLPIFIGLYTALNLAVELRHADFALWINDLSAMENLRIFGIRFPMMVILLTLSMLIQQWTTPTTMDPTQKKVMMAMPLVFGFMFMNFPAGLTLYWLVGNIISITQMKALRGSKLSPFLVTGVVSVATFAFAFLLTKF